MLLLVFPAAVALAAAEPYGKDLLLSSDRWLDESPFYGNARAQADAASPNDAELEAAIARLEARAEAAELELGPYAPALAESLDELARMVEQTGDIPRALELRERALHLIRVNEGLYSPAQGPLVRAILDSLRAGGDFQALDRRYDYFFRLYGAGRPPWSASRWAATLEYLRWQREALRRELGPDERSRLLALYELHDELLQVTGEETSENAWQHYRDIALSQLKTFYLIEERVQPLIEFGDMRRDQLRMRDRGEFDLRRERLESMQRTLGSKGRVMLEDALARIPEDQTVARAELRLALADWLQWHGSRNDAARAYQQLWMDMQSQGLSQLADSWFGRPVPLPDNGVFIEESRAVEGPYELVLIISPSGRPRVADAGLSDERSRGLAPLRRQISALRFRPVIRAGEAVEVRTDVLSFVRFRR